MIIEGLRKPKRKHNLVSVVDLERHRFKRIGNRWSEAGEKLEGVTNTRSLSISRDA